MRVKVLRIVRIILLAAAVIACVAGVVKTKKAGRDVSKIDVQITAKHCYHKENDGAWINGRYYIDYTFEIANHTNVGWKYLQITTYVSDKNGKSLGTITTEFGSSYGASDLKLRVGETVTIDSSIADSANQPGEFFTTLFNSDLSDLVFASEVTGGTYYDD